MEYVIFSQNENLGLIGNEGLNLKVKLNSRRDEIIIRKKKTRNSKPC